MKKTIYCFIISLIVCLFLQGFVNKTHTEVSNNLERLHIIANSNTSKDQELKLEVRDTILKNVSLSDENFLLNCKKIANNIVTKYGYNATVEYGNFYFPSKKYNNIHLPCGNYNAVRIILGEGRGENWWCVLYPPMCIENKGIRMDKYSLNQLKSKISLNSNDIITDDDSNVQIKFKTIEIINELINLIDNL